MLKNCWGINGDDDDDNDHDDIKWKKAELKVLCILLSRPRILMAET